MTFELLIVYKSGENKVVPGVTDYGINSEGCFYFMKNGYCSFITKENVIYFGRRFDYEED